MTPPLLGQRSRGELIAELYDRHADGLFAYCRDQLGDSDTAASVLLAVLSAVPDVAPPRAALYALARREIQRRDVVCAPPAAGAHPVSAFVERILRELRPHQREVLYLSGVCEMSTDELAWVLDVAPDTADELTVSACRRFTRSLAPALASARVPAHLSDAFGALGVAPLRDVLVRAPWAVPSPALRTAALIHAGTTPAPPASPRPGAPAPLKPLWPTTPAWPLPLAEADALTSTSVFSPPEPPPPLPSAGPAFPPSSRSSASPGSPRGLFPPSAAPDRFPDPFSPPERGTVSAHEATTEPIPRLREAVLDALDDAAPRSARRRLQRPKPRGAAPLPAPPPTPVAADVGEDAPPAPDGPSPSPTGTPVPAPAAAEPFRPFVPETRAARARTDVLVASAPRDESAPPGSLLSGRPSRAAGPASPASRARETAGVRPLPRAGGPPLSVPGDRARHARREGTAVPSREAAPACAPVETNAPGGTAKPGGHPRPAVRHKYRPFEHKPVRQRRRQHHDWAWELFGFIVCVICVAIATLVFFAVPTMVTP
ncbi:hypothetical protein GCM10017673_53110 [Streptosporangium violaceochromogenes]|nr:hypothetical protein GCM10017673_53110 [Streptosporangium violaceochromogenes]